MVLKISYYNADDITVDRPYNVYVSLPIRFDSYNSIIERIYKKNYWVLAKKSINNGKAYNSYVGLTKEFKKFLYEKFDIGAKYQKDGEFKGSNVFHGISKELMNEVMPFLTR